VTTIGQDIAKARHRRGLGLREAARQLQISPSYLVGIEKDERTPARRLTERIQSFYGIPRLVDRVRDLVIRRWEAGVSPKGSDR
jgi:transcriptional regulator with XRE-family HTH domain